MTAEAMTARYVVDNHSVGQIAEEHGVSSSTVYRTADLPKPDNMRIIAALRHGFGLSTGEIQRRVHV